MTHHPHFSTEKATVHKEGTTYKDDFGVGNISDFRKLAFIEYDLGIAEAPILYFYRITDDDYLQWIDVFLDDENDEKSILEASKEPLKIVCQYKYDYDFSFIDNILIAFAEFIHGRSMYDGRIIQFKSEIISNAHFLQIQKNIADRKKGIVESILLEFTKENNLFPKVHDAKKGLYFSQCVNSENHYLPISISPGKEEWGCGYCGRKGGIEELKQWISEKKQSKN
ncbi:hypothetical protein [Amniculibacterium aquaticum]|uniref:hypothetical protein n=1 Tax=Amniculibacterium aquaticum TaxID=2479858 RepID=UPI000F5B3E06|nr:hypothetical protein [Amniculibacterium aquaticum]